MLKVKICGITNVDDAKAAVDAGADALGFIFADSPRKVSIETASRIITAIGPWTAVVGVFVDASTDEIRKTAERCRLTAVQLHGNEPATLAQKLGGLRVIKAFRVAPDFRADSLRNYPCDAFLFDTAQAGRFGGTGKIFDWKLLKNARWPRPVIVSGGLNPGNVAAAVKLLRPYAVDVSSGVEKRPGRKDHKLVKEFIRNAKKVAS